MKIKLLTVLLTLFAFSVKAQNNFAQDSLVKKNYEELGDLFYDTKPDTLSCILIANAYFLKAKKKNDLYEMTTGRYYLSDIKKQPSIYLNYLDSLINRTKKEPTKLYPSIFYIEKGDYFFHREKVSKALKEFTIAKGYLKKNKNDSLNAILNVYLGALKSSINDKKMALENYTNAYLYFSKQKFSENYKLISSPINIMSLYLDLNKLDSAAHYMKISENLIRKCKDTFMLNSLKYYKANFHFKSKNYHDAVLGFIKSIKGFSKEENYRLLSLIYSKTGISYDSLKQPKKSYKFHLKADSLFSVKKISSSKTKHSFQYLLNHYKEKENLEKQLEYVDKLLKVKEFYLNDRNAVKEIFTNEYDIPKLKREKEKVEKQLVKEKKESKRNALLFSLAILIILSLLFYQIRKKRDLRKQFLKIRNAENFVNQKNTSTEIVKQQNKESLLPEKVVNTILKGLTNFEKNKEFLSVSLSLNSLANTLNTNTNYLSKVINQHKNSSFSNYVSKLRIEYIIEELKENKKLRKYTVKAIADEAGYKNAESFSKAFYKYTKLKPSYFIKELNKEL